MSELSPEAQAELDEIAAVTKKGFDLSARLKNRGLRRVTLTLFLDEDKGAQLGRAEDIFDVMGNVVGHEREGILGQIEALGDEKESAAVKSELAKLTKKRDELIAELAKSGITVKLQAVPPIISNDCRRKAKEELGIKEKNVPADQTEEFNASFTAHLLSVTIQSVTDNETGAINDKVTLQDAKQMMDYLPAGQFARLDEALARIQYTDAISRSIEVQEDFS